MKPKIVMARVVFSEVIAGLQRYFYVESNRDDRIFSSTELAFRLRDKDGVIATASDGHQRAGRIR